MARQLTLNRVPVDLSILEFDLDSGEDVFLTYTWERREGPPIQRTGDGPPKIAVIDRVPGETTVHPFGLRLGTWLIQEDLRGAEIEEAEKEIARARERSLPADEVEILDRTLLELRTPGRCRAHDSVFQRFFPWYEIVGHQGCGDLTMNLWNVAFMNSDLGRDPESGERPPVLVCLPEEPLEDRTYSCLVKWKGSETGLGRVSIEEVRFRRRTEVESPNGMAWVSYGGRWLPRGDRIEFAVSNQQVIRNGQVVPAVASCHQFGDIRHLIQMPNLNPAGPLYAAEAVKPNGEYRPRKYFRNEGQFGDIWFGEFAFLADRSRNLLRAALAGPVLMDLTPDVDPRQLRGAMQLARYREAPELIPLSEGTWRFVGPRKAPNAVEVYFKRNTYAWTMIGLTPDNRKLLCLACGGRPGGAGYKLEEAAEFLQKAGAWNALLIDEGADVFQKLRSAAGNMVDMVPRIRNRLRATFIFARPRSGLGCLPSPGVPEEPRVPASPCQPPAKLKAASRPPARDQGLEPTCVGFAGAAVRELMTSDPAPLSPRCLYRWCKDADRSPDLLGTYLRTAAETLVRRGICLEKTWPYSPQTLRPPETAKAEGSAFAIHGFVRLDDVDRSATLRNMKCWLHDHGPFVAGIWVYESWLKPSAVDAGVIAFPAPGEKRIGGHAVAVVGYEDKRSCFVFRNSWGPKWGDNGYAYLPYEYIEELCFEAWGYSAARCMDLSTSSESATGQRKES